MRRIALAILPAVTVVALGGCTEDLPVDTNDSVAPDLAASSPMRSAVHWLADLSPVDGGTAQLIRTGTSVSYSFRTTGLESGDVVTLWWVIFNHPDECANPIPAIGAACNVPDLFNPDVEASVMWASGHVVGNSGHATFGGSLREGEVTTFHPAFAGSPGLIDAQGAEIHLVDRTHGHLIPEMVTDMRTSFEGGCTPESSLGFGNGPNTCIDLQAAAFAAH